VPFAGDHQVLIAAAAKAGLSAEAAKAVLDDDEAFLPHVNRELKLSQQVGGQVGR
jgi:predicted DsbA family dithiol-disulfide isomerase